MKLADVLSALKAPTAFDGDTVFLHGAIKADHDPALFRLYRNPNNLGAYFLIRKEEVRGDLHQLTKEDLIGSGFVGFDVFRVPLRSGATIQTVVISTEKV